ncbi:MAG: hypothetical protein SVS85_00255, partial [Candidatus Nanohaloarchaea archaeon]|nr:hypothetical protein [Candidatus Nanohaloarchaea archaeon]
EAVFRGSHDEDQVKITYSDNGPGLSEDLEKSLHEFGLKGKESDGLGWGMALVTHILEESSAEWEIGTGESGFSMEMYFPRSGSK